METPSDTRDLMALKYKITKHHMMKHRNQHKATVNEIA